MESFHYTSVDPQMVPVDMLDVILPEDFYRFDYNFNEIEGEESEDIEEEVEQNLGVVATISRFMALPFNLMFYMLEMGIERIYRKSQYEKH